MSWVLCSLLGFSHSKVSIFWLASWIERQKKASFKSEMVNQVSLGIKHVNKVEGFLPLGVGPQLFYLQLTGPVLLDMTHQAS